MSNMISGILFKRGKCSIDKRRHSEIGNCHLSIHGT